MINPVINDNKKIYNEIISDMLSLFKYFYALNFYR